MLIQTTKIDYLLRATKGLIEHVLEVIKHAINVSNSTFNEQREDQLGQLRMMTKIQIPHLRPLINVVAETSELVGLIPLVHCAGRGFSYMCPVLVPLRPCSLNDALHEQSRPSIDVHQGLDRVELRRILLLEVVSWLFIRGQGRASRR